MAEWIGVNGIAKEIKTQYIGVDGVARYVRKGYIGESSVAREVYPSFVMDMTAIIFKKDEDSGVSYWATALNPSSGLFISNTIQLEFAISVVRSGAVSTGIVFKPVYGSLGGSTLNLKSKGFWASMTAEERRWCKVVYLSNTNTVLGSAIPQDLTLPAKLTMPAGTASVAFELNLPAGAKSRGTYYEALAYLSLTDIAIDNRVINLTQVIQTTKPY